MLIAILLALADPQAAPADLAERKGWATLTIAPALEHTRTVIEIGPLGQDTKARRVFHWVRHTFTDAQGRSSRQWASSKTCPGVDEVVAALGRLPAVAPRVPQYREQVVFMLDGTGYTLETESDYGTVAGTRLVIETNSETPLARWGDYADATLKPCLSSTVPS